MEILDFFMVILFSAFAGLCNRGAGGLWSFWLKRDIGAFGPRMLYGISTMLPLLWFFPLSWSLAGVLVTGGVLQGLARGTGWHGSLDLGLTGETYSHKEVAKKCGIMALCGLGFYLPMSLVAAFVTSNIGVFFGLWLLSFPIFLVLSYLLAELLRIEIPVLQCYKQDFPPFGEILSAFICEVVFCLYISLF